MSESNQPSPSPKEVIQKLFYLVNAFEEQLTYEEKIMNNYTLHDLRSMNEQHQVISQEYFSCLDMIERDDILLRLSREDIEKVRDKIANLASHLRHNKEKISHLEEYQRQKLLSFQKSQQKRSAYYTKQGTTLAVATPTWGESI